MNFNENDFLDKIKNATIRNEPFDHLVIDNLLPDDFYKEFSKEFDGEEFTIANGYEKGDYGNPERFGVDITDYTAWVNSGRSISTKLHQGNYNLLSSKNTANLQYFIDVILKNEKEFYSVLKSKLPTERNQEDNFFHVTAIKDSDGYEIIAHTDGQNIYTILFYAAETDINKDMGLSVYREGGTTPVRIYNTFGNGTRNLEVVDEINFIPNRMIIFAPSNEGEVRTPTWHSVNEKSQTKEIIGTRNSFQMFFYNNG